MLHGRVQLRLLVGGVARVAVGAALLPQVGPHRRHLRAQRRRRRKARESPRYSQENQARSKYIYNLEGSDVHVASSVALQ